MYKSLPKYKGPFQKEPLPHGQSTWHSPQKVRLIPGPI